MEQASYTDNYIFIISSSGGIVLMIISIMAFCNVENFHIPKGKNINSGLIPLIVSIFYIFIAIYLFIKNSKTIKTYNNIGINDERLIDTIEDIPMKNDINNASPEEKSLIEEDKKSDDVLL